MLMSQWIRVFHSDNGVLTDFSIAAQNSDTMAIPMVAAEDFIYLAQYFPFNNFYFDVNTVNTNAAGLEVQLWDGNAWINAVDEIDGTTVGGVTLARSGVLQFTPDRDLNDWQIVNETQQGDAPVELQTLNIYDMYWLRVKASADLNVGTVLNKIGYNFATDEMLEAIDPEIDQYLEAWEAGKTSWKEQIQLASQHVVWDLKARGLIKHQGQLLRMDDVSFATAYRAIMLIYSILGEGFKERREIMLENYNSLLSIQRFTLDKNQDGDVSRGEVVGTGKGLIR